MADVEIEYVDEVHVKIKTNFSVEHELLDHFSFYAHNYKYHPLFKNKVWDGKIRLYNRKNKLIYKGLLNQLIKFCDDRDYNYNINFDDTESNVSILEIEKFVDSLKLPEHFERRDYQIESITKAIRKKRSLLLSPTASGKSFIIYSILRYFNVKTLIIVPTTTLVDQLCDDFRDYSVQDDGWDIDSISAKIYGGSDKNLDKNITISTWQSLQNLDASWFKKNNFGCVFVDEAHTATATVLPKILEKIKQAKYRFGLTGTIEDSIIHEFSLSGLFGEIIKVTDTKTLMEQKYVSELKIKVCQLMYSDTNKKLWSKAVYKEEIDFLISHKRRNAFIENLALSLKGNTLVLFNFVEKHGKILYANLKKKFPDRQIFYVSGEVDTAERNQIRKLVDEKKTGCIIVASYKTFQQGINIVNLHNIIFAHPTKAKIRIIQSIGRGLRKNDEKTECTLFDIADDLSWKKKVNFSLKHLVERLRLYKNEKFTYKIHKIELEKNG